MSEVSPNTARDYSNNADGILHTTLIEMEDGESFVILLVSPWYSTNGSLHTTSITHLRSDIAVLTRELEPRE